MSIQSYSIHYPPRMYLRILAKRTKQHMAIYLYTIFVFVKLNEVNRELDVFKILYIWEHPIIYYSWLVFASKYWHIFGCMYTENYISCFLFRNDGVMGITIFHSTLGYHPVGSWSWSASAELIWYDYFAMTRVEYWLTDLLPASIQLYSEIPISHWHVLTWPSQPQETYLILWLNIYIKLCIRWQKTRIPRNLRKKRTTNSFVYWFRHESMTNYLEMWMNLIIYKNLYKEPIPCTCRTTIKQIDMIIISYIIRS